METRSIGSLDVPTVGIGCNNFGKRIDAAQAERVVHAALDEGVTFFDTADVYGGRGGSEEALGQALGDRRDEAVVATKFGGDMGPGRGGAGPAWVRRAVEDSLRRLGTDRIDLYQQHYPDDAVPVADTLEALDQLVDAGKVREIGCSNVTPGQIDWALRTSGTGRRGAGGGRASADEGYASFASVQNHYNLLHRGPEEEAVIDTCTRHGLSLLPYYPLARGLLTGKYTRDQAPPAGSRLAGAPDTAERLLSDETFDVLERLDAFARDRGHTLLELAFSWLLAQPTVACVIAGATTPEQVAANHEAAGWDLTPEELVEADLLSTGR
ncbi:aldo/keto reductase [soil metagenome]